MQLESSAMETGCRRAAGSWRETGRGCLGWPGAAVVRVRDWGGVVDAARAEVCGADAPPPPLGDESGEGDESEIRLGFEVHGLLLYMGGNG